MIPPVTSIPKTFGTSRLVCLLIAMSLYCASIGMAGTSKTDDESIFLNQPIQITSKTESVLDMAVSADGSHILYISGDKKPTTLWWGSADPAITQLPIQLVSGSSVKSSPAISPDGRYVAYVATDYDVKGDIFLIDINNEDHQPVRLTGRKTEDGGPCFSSTGRYLYFHQASGNSLRQLAVLDLKQKESYPELIEIGGDGMYCSISPNDQKLAFVSYRNGKSGDIWFYDIAQKNVRQITGGPAIDLFPQWAADSRTLYFSRIGSDTNHDKKLTPDDNSIICRIDIPESETGNHSIPYPVTPLNISCFKPYATKSHSGSNLYFLSDMAGVSNCWTITEEGYIHTADTAESQFTIAKQIANRLPYDPYLSLLAFVHVVERFGDDSAVSAAAAYEAGNILYQLDLPASANAAYDYIIKTYSTIIPESKLAKIKQTVINFQTTLNSTTRESDKRTLISNSLSILDKIASQHSGYIALEAKIESATMLFNTTDRIDDLMTALERLDGVIDDDSADNSQKARALFLKAKIYGKTATPEKAAKTFRTILIDFPEQKKWGDMAVEQILDILLSGYADADFDEKMKILNSTADANKLAAPSLAMGALNRIGDLFYNADQPTSAKSAYRHVIDTWPILTTQTAAARLSLAEILFKEEQFRQAIDLYETEIHLRKTTDRIYQLARRGYIRKTVSIGEFLYRLGEIPSSRNTFKELIDYDETIIEGHRGYIKCAAASGDIENVLEKYKNRMSAAPDNPLWLYCTGLCLTYQNTEEATRQARKLIQKAIRFKGNIEYFHQTLGYVDEVLETVYGKSKRLESALTSYQKAYFLNDHEKNPENAANLELNIGNSYYLLGQFGKAFDFYAKRKKREIPFSNPDTKIIFYKRFGECAFQDNDIQSTITGYLLAIKNINEHLDPIAASRAFDRLQRYIKDQITGPAQTRKKLKKQAQQIAEKLSDIGLIVSELTRKSSPPPSSEWQAYKKEMFVVVEKQKKLNKNAFKLAKKLNAVNLKETGKALVITPDENLTNLTRRIEKALLYPERLIELKIEIMDRLGLAFQEKQQWKKAADTFDAVFLLNQKSQNFQNLAKNKRSTAYNTYMLAGTASGDKRTMLLKKASKGFYTVLSLIDKYGVPKPEKKEKKALINLSLTASLDKTSATQAAKGFSEIQEKRLAWTFISRIQLELGNLETAKTQLEKQLAQYPPHKSVGEKDRYGVSLLYHRAGLLANATGDNEAAFDQFAESASLCMEMKSPVSTAINITNMAAIFQKSINEKPKQEVINQKLFIIRNLDKQAQKLLLKNAGLTGLQILTDYHNAMGIFYTNMSDSQDSDITGAVRRIELLQTAISHFLNGLGIFKDKNLRLSRKLLETKTALHLNMAAAAQKLGENKTADLHFQKALENAEAGVFPDMHWRALLGLGKISDALNILEMVTLYRAGCEPMEIIKGFGSLVLEEIKNGNFETAFNLAERISELERFNRMAGFIRPKNNRERALFLKMYPHIKRIDDLNIELSEADEDKKPFIKKRIDTEQSLLNAQKGINGENLPFLVRNIRNRSTQDLAIRLTGISLSIEEIAEKRAALNIRTLSEIKIGEKTMTTSRMLEKKYQSLVNDYRQLAENAYYDRPKTVASDFITLMSPEPVEAIDLVDTLSEDDAVVRILNTGNLKTPYAAFFISTDGVTAIAADTISAVKEKMSDEIDWTIPYIATEEPVSLNFESTYPFALSGTHLFRCIANKKPFKRKLMSIPKTDFDETLFRPFEITSLDSSLDVNDPAFPRNFSSINTLFITGGPKTAMSVPTNPGDRAHQFFSVNLSPDVRFDLEKLLAGTKNLSLSLISDASVNNAYLIGHLFAIYGCPGIIFVNNTDTQTGMIADILKSYAENSGIQALRSAITSAGDKNDTASPKIADRQLAAESAEKPKINPVNKPKPDTLLYLGYQGMTSAESKKFAKKNFIRYIKTGRSAFDHNDYSTALVLFENAISVAKEIKKYTKYLPDLYKYGRESAFRSGNMKTALLFAKNLADLTGNLRPESKPHAEALLRLGLMYAKLDDYENAIPVIESSVTIMSNLKPDGELINAMTDLGIVLENATNYETALSRFKAAADLSRTLDQSELLGDQYLNIGRVYDLRLNQYAIAILNYKKALDIFFSIHDVEKIAESKLDMGRCYRLLGNFSTADKYYTQSMKLISEQAPDNKNLLIIKVKILIEQANNAWFQGRYAEALRLQRQCYTMAIEQKLPLIQVLSLNTAGLIWWTLGDYEKALSELKNALEKAQDLAVRKDEISSTLNNLGLVYRDMGNYNLALETFEKAIRIDTDIKSKWGTAYDYRNKGLTYLKMKHPEKAAPLFDQAYTISTSIGNRINAAKAMLGKGDALFALKDFENAKKAFHLALKDSRSMRIKETQWRSLYGLARISISFDKDLLMAEKQLRESVDVIEQLRGDIKIKQLKENFITNKLSVYETLVKLLADTGKPVQAFEMAERSRARNFIDLLGNQQIGFSNKTENRLFKKQALIKSEIEEYETLLAMSKDSSEAAMYKKSIETLTRDLENVMLDMELQNPQLASLVSVPAVNADTILKKIQPGVALLSYYLLDNEIFCWVLRSNTGPDAKGNIKGTPAKSGITLIRISSEKTGLERKILEYRRIIQNLEPFEKHAKALYNRLIAPVLPKLNNIHTLGIIPHGSLHYLSFATLFDGDNFVVDQFALFYLPSAAVFDYTLNRRIPRPPAPPKVLAIGNPDLGDPILDLPFAEQEVGAMKWDFANITVLTREKATKNWVIDNIGEFDIIHIASHGEFDPINPLLSAIKLARPVAKKTKTDKNFTKSNLDGNLDAGEIFGLKIDADMVFLSACQTGLGKISAGDDVIGLNRSFFFAGTHTVISSLWRVSDVSTAILIKSFYRRYLTQNKADSLQQSALHVKTRYPHPGYWGAFTLVGDYY